MTLRRKGCSMNKATKMLTMTGMALVAGAAFGASPAAAAPAAPAPSSTTAAASSSTDRFLGYYPSRRSCERAAYRLVRWGNWDCDFIAFGPHRFQWRLTVDTRWNDWNDWHNGG